MNDQGIVLYPGAVTEEKSFRVGCIGQVDVKDIDRMLNVLESALDTMGVAPENLAP